MELCRVDICRVCEVERQDFAPDISEEHARSVLAGGKVEEHRESEESNKEFRGAQLVCVLANCSDSKSRALHKSIIEGVKEFKNSYYSTASNNWLIVFTTGEDNTSRSTLENVTEALKSSTANLLIFSFGSVESGSLEGLCKLTKEGIYMAEPTRANLDLAMTAISYVDIDLPPVIVEQFT
eukprot:TRINITY_DN1796_c0_g2_i4.p1 TRINITY_DN1796_c0_g2~~TRINITY_DN1796_c0_g2_i4.p1  ORF type:complete len:181 (-),score=7.28 TRINITY_DN1796_c0_g2_i4:61-603(-)